MKFFIIFNITKSYHFIIYCNVGITIFLIFCYVKNYNKFHIVFDTLNLMLGTLSYFILSTILINQSFINYFDIFSLIKLIICKVFNLIKNLPCLEN